MKIANVEMENTIPINKFINTFIIENKKQFYNYVNELIGQNSGDDGDFVLSHKEKILSMSKDILIISDVFSIDLNERRIVNGLFKEINKILNDNFLESYYKLNSDLVTLMSNVSLETVVPSEFNDDYDVVNLLKLINFKFTESECGFVSKVSDYLLVANQFIKPKLFIIINARNMFSDEDVLDFNKFLEYNKIKVLFIESVFIKKQDCERVFIIDNDLCELIL